MLPTVQQFEAINRFLESREIDPKSSVCGADDRAVEDILPPAEVEGPRSLSEYSR